MGKRMVVDPRKVKFVDENLGHISGWHLSFHLGFYPGDISGNHLTTVNKSDHRQDYL